jgi:hypothetical protein
MISYLGSVISLMEEQVPNDEIPGFSALWIVPGGARKEKPLQYIQTLLIHYEVITHRSAKNKREK